MNISGLITEIAQIHPDKIANVFAQKKCLKLEYIYRSYTFLELEKRINQYANALIESGLRKGDKTLLFIKPSLELAPIVFALFKTGIVPILLDPGLGKKNVFEAINTVKPKAIIAEPIVHLLKLFAPDVFSSIELSYALSNIPLFGVKNLKSISTNCITDFEVENINEHETAAVLYTSGGTGKPKGAVYTHKIFYEQTQLLKSAFDLKPNHVDLAGFPLFALFTLALGMTSIIPDIDATKPAKANGHKLLKHIQDFKISFLSGSPAIWKNLLELCEKNHLILESVEHLVMFGAPIAPSFHERFKPFLPNGSSFAPYGATEALPLIVYPSHKILNHKRITLDGGGICLGLPGKDINLNIIKASQIPEASLNLLPINAIGEIVANGPVVTSSYFASPEATHKAKIIHRGELWHRMGDVGRIDDMGVVWFYGRLVHAVELQDQVLYPMHVEPYVNTYAGIERCAFISDSNKTASLVIELSGAKNDFKINDFRSFLNKHKYAKFVEKIYFIKQMPVDIRHNIKIDRVYLSELAKSGKL